MDSFATFGDYCEALKELILRKKDAHELVEEGQKIQARLVSNPNLILDKLAIFIEEDKEGKYWPVDLNDFTIYRDKDKLFSVRLFIWEAIAPYPIHDHGAWGLVGGLANQVKETKYRRLDDGSKPNYAEIEVKSEAIVNPGDTTYVLPLNEGIHRMEAIGNTTGLTLHTYGKAERTGFIYGYMRQVNGTYTLYPMKIQRQILAIKALESIGTSQARDILETISGDNNETVKLASLEALKTFKK